MRRAAVTLALVATLALPASAGAAKGKDKGEDVTVMTRNVFLGADLGPAIDAPTLNAAIDGAAEIYREVELTNFPERAIPLAKEIKKAKPDLVGLQEVANWREQIPGDGGWTGSGGIGQPAETEKYNFLTLLTERLGNKYRVASVQEEFDAELPVDLDGDDNTGTLGGEIDARLTMRDVILARKGVKTKKLDSGHFQTRYEPMIGGSIPLPVDRGWLSAEANVDGAKFKFVNTHLEAFGDPTIREAQAQELVDGPLDTKKQVVLVGDLNSGTTKRHNIGRPELGHDPNDPLAFKVFQKADFKDNGAVQSCCYPDMFDEGFEFTHTVDHVLTRPGLKTLDSFVTGNDPGEMTPSGLWPSDHGGVVSTLRVP
jgi:endonuclease/exonuclease/phosphatase family metal-dependent hydrolase